jgi:hypothetical protein
MDDAGGGSQGQTTWWQFQDARQYELGLCVSPFIGKREN